MALEAVVYPQDPFSYYTNSFLRSDYGNYPFGLHLDEEDQEEPLQDYKGICVNNDNNNNNNSAGSCNGGWDHVQPNNTSSPDTAAPPDLADGQAAGAGGRRKRRRVKSAKNREEIENQRMTHIAVERNRRKQMNEYLAVLRSLMPPSYSQRGDQASIIGGAINFVKELEQLLQSMETQKVANDSHSCDSLINPQQPFSDFFSFPQYSTRSTAGDGVADLTDPASADIEVTMVESHANLKIQSRKRPKQLLRLVAGLQALRLGVLHLNVTSAGDMVLYSVSVKVEDGCHLTTVDEIAAAVNQMFHRIDEEPAFS